MKIPDKIRIGSMYYTITLSDKILTLDHKVCKGLVNYEMHTIEINNSVQDDQGVEQTFLHEVVHALVNERNFDFCSTDNEMKVDEFASGLHQIIKDNPGIFKD